MTFFLPPVAAGIVAAVVLSDALVNPFSFDPNTITSIGVSGVLTVFIGLMLTGRLVPGSLLDRAEERATKATEAAEKAAQTAADAVAAVAKLTTEHEEERRSFEGEMAGLTRELARISAPMSSAQQRQW